MHEFYNSNPHLLLTLSIEQAAAISGFSYNTISNAYDRGEFGICVPEDLIRGRIPRTELDRWIKANTASKIPIDFDNRLNDSGFKKRRKRF